jgi:hypothetical protein
MAKNLAYLRAQTRTFLDEAVQFDWKADEVDREINNGYQRVVTSVMEVYEEFYLNTATFNTVANQQEYGETDGLPATLFKVRRLEVNYNPAKQNSVRTLVRSTTIDHVMTDLGNTNPTITAFHSPVFYLLGGGSTDPKIGLIPVPTSSGPDWNAQDNAKLWFIEMVDDMVESTDLAKIPYPDRYAQLISRFAASVLLSKGQQEEKVALAYMEIFNRENLLMQQQLEDRVSEGTKTVVDTAGEDVDFSSYGLI